MKREEQSFFGSIKGSIILYAAISTILIIAETQNVMNSISSLQTITQQFQV